ncbi:MAG: hypothetical protein ACYTBZ_12815, partial [Planctomycetota bacterium]
LSFAAGTGGEGKEDGSTYGTSIPAVNDGPSAPCKTESTIHTKSLDVKRRSKVPTHRDVFLDA